MGSRSNGRLRRGGPAAGKTTLAGALADRAGLVVLSRDRVRKEMLGLDPVHHYPAAPGHGIYTSSVTDQTYRQLADQADALLKMGGSVAVDASLTAARNRDLFRRVADAAHSQLSELKCRASETVVQQRLRHRKTAADRYTDAGEAAAEALRESAEPWPEAQEIDTGQDATVCVQEAERAVGLRSPADLS